MDSIYVFLFQAEDGIRDLVRSRGLGDVYKRQGFLIILFGILADISALNRQVLEEMLYRQRKRDLELQ